MTDAQDTQWLDDIISQLTVDTGEEYMKLHTGEKSFDASNSYMTYYENQAKQAILAQVAQFFVTRREAEAREVEARIEENRRSMERIDRMLSNKKNVIEGICKRLKAAHRLRIRDLRSPKRER